MLLVALCMMQLAACASTMRNDGVPTQYMSAADVRGYSSNIRLWGDSYASYPAERISILHNERAKASRTDPSIGLDQINALTLRVAATPL